MNKWNVFKLATMLTLCILCGCAKGDKILSETTISIKNVEVSDDDLGFLCVKDGHLFDRETQEEFYVIGVNMDNNTWNAEITPGNRCMDQSSYAEIKAIGFNTIRFGLAYSMTLSDDFFLWLDENIQWAEEAGLKIILDMHAPQGGIQLRNKQASALFWSEETVQNEYIDLWVDIATRYRDNKCVIMYDLLNEPLVIADSEEEGNSKYVTFMQKLICAIREVDKKHVICVEGFSVQRHDTRVDEFTYVANSSEEWQNLIDEENIIFDTHTYGPTVFTMQSEKKAVAYEDVLVIVGEKSLSGTEIYTREIKEGFQWTSWETGLLQMPNEEVNTGVVKYTLKGAPGNTIVYIDNIVVEEYDTKGNYLGNVYECYFDQEPYRWTEHGDGDLEVVQYGFDGNGGSWCMSATKDNAEFTIKQTASSVNGMFEVNPENYYKIRFVANSNVSLESGMLKTEIAGYKSKYIGGLGKYANYLVGNYVSKRINTGRAQICNEFGCSYTSIKNGGDRYLYEVVGAFYDSKVNFCLFAYTGYDFGLMYDSNRDFGTSQCLIRQESYDATYKALNQDTTYEHIFKNVDTMNSYENMQNGQKVLVLGKEYAGVGPKYEYWVSTEMTSDSIPIRNGLYANLVSTIEE